MRLPWTDGALDELRPPPFTLPQGVVIAWMALILGIVLGRWASRLSMRLATGDPSCTGRRLALTRALLVAGLGGAAALGGPRPAVLGLACAAVAGVVLGAVDLAVHRLPDVITYPAAGAVAVAYTADAAVLGTWPDLLRAVLAAAAGFGVAALVAAISPAGLGFGDVKLLGFLGLVLGWFGWGVLLVGVFLGLLTGAVVSLALLATRRAGWRTAIPFGPPLLFGAVLALVVHGPVWPTW